MSRALLLLIALVTLGCEEDDEIGTPCEADEDCSDELVCDIHEGQGTCQQPHDH